MAYAGSPQRMASSAVDATHDKIKFFHQEPAVSLENMLYFNGKAKATTPVAAIAGQRVGLPRSTPTPTPTPPTSPTKITSHHARSPATKRVLFPETKPLAVTAKASLLLCDEEVDWDEEPPAAAGFTIHSQADASSHLHHYAASGTGDDEDIFNMAHSLSPFTWSSDASTESPASPASPATAPSTNTPWGFDEQLLMSYHDAVKRHDETSASGILDVVTGTNAWLNTMKK
jgi:hypothetical protein